MTEAHDRSNLPRPPKRAWHSFVLGLILLASGAVIGAGSAVVFVEQQIASVQNETLEGSSDRFTRKMRSRLGLTQEQSEKLGAVFSKHHKSISAIREEIRPRFEAELEKMRAEVNDVLTPEQGELWKEKFEHSRRRWTDGGRRGPTRDGLGGFPRRRPGDGRPARGANGHDGGSRVDGPHRKGPPPPPPKK